MGLPHLRQSELLDQPGSVDEPRAHVGGQVLQLDINRFVQRLDRPRYPRTISQEIAFSRLCGAFALLALVIACVGLYGTMTQNMMRRVDEIGVRMALGAQRRTVLVMILRSVLLLGLGGVLIGVPASLAATRFIESFLWGIAPNDAAIIAAAALTLLAAVLVAGYSPAWRASRIDPNVALRYE
jgi:ABC-type lipoprotein release transport system permease subunit